MAHPKYPEDSTYALPGECTQTTAISHEDLYLLSDEDQRDRCAYCLLPYHSSIINIANRREKTRHTHVETPMECTDQSSTAPTNLPATYRDLTMPQLPFPYKHSAPNPIDMEQRVERTDQPTPMPTNVPSLYRDPAMPCTHPTGGVYASYGQRPLLFNAAPSGPIGGSVPSMAGSNVLKDIEKGYTGVKGGFKEAKQLNAEKNRRSRPSYEPDRDVTWLRIDWVSCQFYTASEGAGEEELELGMEKGRWYTWSRVPDTEPNLTLKEWLKILCVRLRGNQGAVCRNATAMSFCDRIHKSRSKNQDQPPQVYWLDDYDQLTIGHILAKGGMPWRAKRDSQRPNAYQAFVVIYRERVNPPLSQGRLARPYKEPPKPCQLATGNSSRDNDQDDDPFLEGVPSSDIGSIPSSSQPTLTLEQQPRSSEEPRRFKHYTLDSPTPPPLMLNPNEQNPSSSLTLSSWVKETSHSSTQSQKQNRANATTPTLPTTSQKSSFVDLTGVQDSGSDTESSLPSLRSYFAKKYPNGSWKQESIARQENQAEAVASSPGPDTAQSPVPQTEGLAAPRGSQNPARSPKVRELHSVTLGTGAASLDRHRSSSTLDTEMDTQRDLTNLQVATVLKWLITYGVSCLLLIATHPTAPLLENGRPAKHQLNLTVHLVEMDLKLMGIIPADGQNHTRLDIMGDWHLGNE